MPELKPRTALPYILHQADMMAAQIEWETDYLPKFKAGPKIMPISLANICLEKTALRSLEAQDLPKKPKRIGSRPDPIPESILEMIMNGREGTQM